MCRVPAITLPHPDPLGGGHEAAVLEEVTVVGVLDQAWEEDAGGVRRCLRAEVFEVFAFTCDDEVYWWGGGEVG